MRIHPPPIRWVHAIVSGLSAADGTLAEAALDSPNHAGVGHVTGQNSYFQHAWLPPDPPRGTGEHRYVFQVFALGAGPAVREPLGRRAFIDLVLERAIGVGCIIGTYERSERESLDEPQSAAVDSPLNFSAEPSPV